MTAFSKIILLSFRSQRVRFLPTYELLLCQALRENKVCDEIELYTLMEDERVEDYLDRWRGADLVLCWENIATKAPSFVKQYFRQVPRLKSRLDVPVFFGGYWATCYGRDFKEFDCFDRLFEGYDIDKVVESLKALHPCGERFMDVRGPSRYANYTLDPGYLATPETHIDHRILHGYYSSFACPNNCYFCSANAMRNAGSGFAARKLSQVKEDLDALTEVFDFDGLVIKDLNLFYDPQRAMEILRYLQQKGKRTQINLDITVRDIDEEVLSELRDLDVADMLYFGLESFDPEVRKRLNKPYTNEQLEEAFRITDRLGLAFTGNVMCGLPWQTLEDIDREIQTALDYMKRYPNVFIVFSVYKPEYGTTLTDEYYPGVYDSMTMEQVIDVYLNDVAPYQQTLFGDRYEGLDFQQLSYAMRLINNCRFHKTRTTTLLQRKLFSWLERVLQREVRPPYFRNPFIRYLLQPGNASFIMRLVLPTLAATPWKVLIKGPGVLGRELVSQSRRLYRICSEKWQGVARLCIPRKDWS